MKLWRTLAALLVAGAVACDLRARAAEVTVFAAASLAEVLQEMAPGFRAAAGHEVRFNFGASGTLARQIEAGAPADVFFPADEARMDRLAEAGLVLVDTRRTVVANTLVVVGAVGARVSRWRCRTRAGRRSPIRRRC